MKENNNLKLVKQIEQNFKEGKLDEVLKCLVDDVIYIVAGSADYPFAGCYRGRKKVKNLFDTLSQIAIEVEEFEPKEYIVQGDKVVELGREASLV